MVELGDGGGLERLCMIEKELAPGVMYTIPGALLETANCLRRRRYPYIWMYRLFTTDCPPPATP